MVESIKGSSALHGTVLHQLAFLVNRQPFLSAIFVAIDTQRSPAAPAQTDAKLSSSDGGGPGTFRPSASAFQGLSGADDMWVEGQDEEASLRDLPMSSMGASGPQLLASLPAGADRSRDRRRAAGRLRCGAAALVSLPVEPRRVTRHGPAGGRPSDTGGSEEADQPGITGTSPQEAAAAGPILTVSLVIDQATISIPHNDSPSRVFVVGELWAKAVEQVRALVMEGQSY